MVVRIKSPHSLQRALNYNEKKVQDGHAKCVHAENYLLNADQMNFYEKMERLQTLISRNERAKKSNTLHISLNFDPSENLKKETLISIAKMYMDKIGFANQPYLVYQHDDAGHPHIHILTTNIQDDGKRIDTYNIGRNQSETARKNIEKLFGLVQARQKQEAQLSALKPVQMQKVQYGKSETRRSITNVLDAVLNHYKYSSLAELNAVLKQYNVVADRGLETSTMYKCKGLVYRLLDEKGNNIGVPIKASLIYCRPTLSNLEKKFTENEELRQPDKVKLKTRIDWVLSNKPATLDNLIAALQKEKVQTILRKNKDDRVYGITFIDYRTKAVFNGSDLGKLYSIAGLQEKLKAYKKTDESTQQNQKEESPLIKEKEIVQDKSQQTDRSVNVKEDLLKDLLDTEKNFNRLPYEFLKKKKRKRPKNL
jgi:hypothetical protein